MYDRACILRRRSHEKDIPTSSFTKVSSSSGKDRHDTITNNDTSEWTVKVEDVSLF